MEQTQRGNRLHIGFYGRTNVGKSTLINHITNQEVSVVSEQKGTTTDVVYKPMELLPIGPVVFMDTAGIDDNTKLGKKRITKTIQTLDKSDVAVLIADFEGINNNEKELLKLLKDKNTPIMFIITKNDIKKIDNNKLNEIKTYTDKIIFTDFKDKSITQKFKGR